jgi:putative flippase GtrA
MIHEGLKYISVGLVNTAITVLIMVVLNSIGFYYVVYTSIAYLAGFVSSFLLNGTFTFNSGVLSVKSFLWFLFLNTLILGLVQLVQILMIEIVALPEIVGVFFGMVLYTCVGFIVNKKYVFR